MGLVEPKEKKPSWPNWKKHLVRAAVLVPLGIAAWIGGINLLTWSRSLYNEYWRSDPSLLEPIKGAPQSVLEADYLVSVDSFYANIRWHSARIFPKSLPNGAAAFFLHSESVKGKIKSHDRWEVFLECAWSPEEFTKERERLSCFSIKGKAPLLSNDLFPLPSCVFIYNDNSIFEYAIFSEDSSTVYYVSLSDVGPLAKNIVFDFSLAPTKRLVDSDVASAVKLNSYDIMD